MTPSRLLILGGTTEASLLCRRLAGGFSGFAPILSLAGRTRNPVLPPVPCRIGGFGGISGLTDFLRAEKIALLVDATHPFAARISRNAVAAAACAKVPLLALRRPPWIAQPGDRWTLAASLAAAAEALGPIPRRVFLTIGQQELAAFCGPPRHHYLVRSVDAPDPHALPPGATTITARGPFDEAAEMKLLRDHDIEVLATKNSGGEATRAKLAAARSLCLPVIMVIRPALPDCETVPDVAAVLAWLDRHASLRGEWNRGV